MTAQRDHTVTTAIIIHVILLSDLATPRALHPLRKCERSADSKQWKTYTQPQAAESEQDTEDTVISIEAFVPLLCLRRCVVRPTTMHGYQKPSQHKLKGLQHPMRPSRQPGAIFAGGDGCGTIGTSLNKSAKMAIEWIGRTEKLMLLLSRTFSATWMGWELDSKLVCLVQLA